MQDQRDLTQQDFDIYCQRHAGGSANGQAVLFKFRAGCLDLEDPMSGP